MAGSPETREGEIYKLTNSGMLAKDFGMRDQRGFKHSLKKST